MDKISFIQPIELTDEQKSTYAEIMANATKLLAPLAQELYGDRGLRKLRNNFRTGNLNVDCVDCMKSLTALIELEDTILSGYIWVALPLCRAFHAKYGDSFQMDFDDFVQEAAIAIVDAMLGYNGKNEFSTYVYCSVKNRLVNITNPKVTTPPIVRNEEDDLNLTDGDRFVDPHNQRDEEYREMLDVIESAPLNEQERDLIDYALNDASTGWQRSLAKEWNLTHQRINQIYQSAQKKISDFENRKVAA